VEMLVQIAILEKNVETLVDVAMRGMESDQPNALAYSAIVFTRLNRRVHALRCFVKLAGSPFTYLAEPTVSLLLRNLEGVNPVVREVIREEFRPSEKPPETFAELMAAAKGHLVVGEEARAIEFAIRAIAENELTFKVALDVFVYATYLAGSDEFGGRVSDAIRAKYPQYELLPESTEEYLPQMD
jgi:hypothetical protein